MEENSESKKPRTIPSIPVDDVGNSSGQAKTAKPATQTFTPFCGMLASHQASSNLSFSSKAVPKRAKVSSKANATSSATDTLGLTPGSRRVTPHDSSSSPPHSTFDNQGQASGKEPSHMVNSPIRPKPCARETGNIASASSETPEEVRARGELRSHEHFNRLEGLVSLLKNTSMRDRCQEFGTQDPTSPGIDKLVSSCLSLLSPENGSSSIIETFEKSLSILPREKRNEIEGQFWKRTHSHVTNFLHMYQLAESLRKTAYSHMDDPTDKVVYNTALELFREAYGDEHADAACTGLSRLFKLDEMPSLSVTDFLNAPKPTARKVAREDALIICLTYIHDPKAVNRVLRDRINDPTMYLIREAVMKACAQSGKKQIRIWNDITNSFAKQDMANVNWVGGGLIPYLLFEHICVGFYPTNTVKDRLWPRVECQLASLLRGSFFVSYKKEASSAADLIDYRDNRKGSADIGTGIRFVHVALSKCANWGLSGPIFLLDTWWEDDRQKLACMFGRLLKCEHVQDMIAIASSKPMLNPDDLFVRTKVEYENILDKGSFALVREATKARQYLGPEDSRGDADNVTKEKIFAVTDELPVSTPGTRWRAVAAFLPSRFEYAPMTEEVEYNNERNTLGRTRVVIYETSDRKIYALASHMESWTLRFSVLVGLRDTKHYYTSGKVTSCTRIVANTAECATAIMYDLMGRHSARQVAFFRGKRIRWTH